MNEIEKLINKSFKEFNSSYDLKDVSKEVIELTLKELYTKMMGSAMYIIGSPYLIKNNEEEIEKLEAKEERTEEEEKMLTSIKNNLNGVEDEVKKNKQFVEYFTAMTKNLKSLIN